MKSADDVKAVMDVLLANRKIASATHNIMAYRISSLSKTQEPVVRTTIRPLLCGCWHCLKHPVALPWPRIPGSKFPDSLLSSIFQIIQDCDDDGESAAGGRLLHMLQIMGVVDVVSHR